MPDSAATRSGIPASVPMPRLLPWPWTSKGPGSPATQAASSRSSVGSNIDLEPRQLGMAHRARMHVDTALLRAAVQRRIHLARIEADLRIECVLDAMLLVEIGLVELVRHEVTFLETDAVLARQDAADIDTQLQYLVAE